MKTEGGEVVQADLSVLKAIEVSFRVDTVAGTLIAALLTMSGEAMQVHSIFPWP